MLTFSPPTPDLAETIASWSNLSTCFLPANSDHIRKNLQRALNSENRTSWIGMNNHTPIGYISFYNGPYLGYFVNVLANPETISVDQAMAFIDFFLTNKRENLNVDVCLNVSEKFPNLGIAAVSRGFNPLGVQICQQLNIESFSPQEQWHPPESNMTFLPLIDVENQPKLLRSLYELELETSSDVPNMPQSEVMTYEGFLEMLKWKLKSCSIVAVDTESKAIAFSNLDEHSEGVLISSGTGVARAHRNKGLAYAVKLKSAEAAKAAGKKLICTSTDSSNAPMRAINSKLGFTENGKETFFVKKTNVTQ